MILYPSLFIENCPSTNGTLKTILENKTLKDNILKDYFFIYTNYQSAGRGMATNCWESENNKNILASFLFFPSTTPKQQFYFNQFFALSIQKTIASYLPQAQIKWPNDIYINKKKIAGILIEHSLNSQTITHTIAGVGININQTNFSANIPNPTSLTIETQQHFEIDTILNQIIDNQHILYPILQSNNFNQLHQLYLEKLLNLDIWAHYEICQQPIYAKIIGIDSYGRLQLIDKKNHTYTCQFKEIKYIFE